MDQDGPPNVLLVVLDCVRAQNTTIGGYHRNTTPFLSQLADEATLYTEARAPSTWTLPSHVSMFTGLSEPEHRITVNDRIDPSTTIVDWLSNEQGYSTGVFSENVFLTSHPTGIHRCFDRVVTATESSDSTERSDGFWYIKEFLDWRSNTAGPWFACINLMDAHRPFTPRPQFDRWGSDVGRQLQANLSSHYEWEYYGDSRPLTELALFRDLYDGGIRQVDTVVKRLVSGLRSEGKLDETLVVIAGDHGEGFGEPAEIPRTPDAITHGIGVNDELLHVPLLVRQPRQSSSAVVDEPATLTRLAPVVRNHVEGVRGDRSSEFVPDANPVVVGRPAVDANLQKMARENCDDPDRFNGRLRAYYTKEDSTLYKYVMWGQKSAKLRFVDYHRMRVDADQDTATERIETTFDSLSDRDVATNRSDPKKIKGVTKERLQDLGYLS